jgi:hypothetical protein
MTAVSWHGVMSLDGFITAPGDDMRWIFELAGPSDGVDDGLRCCFHRRHPAETGLETPYLGSIRTRRVKAHCPAPFARANARRTSTGTTAPAIPWNRRRSSTSS